MRVMGNGGSGKEHALGQSAFSLFDGAVMYSEGLDLIKQARMCFHVMQIGTRNRTVFEGARVLPMCED